MTSLQNHAKVYQKKIRSWRHNRDVKINIVTQLTFILYENCLLSLKMPFSIAPGQLHKIPLRDFDLTQHRDTVTSWRHGVTKLNLFYLSQLVDVLGRLFFSFFLWYFGLPSSRAVDESLGTSPESSHESLGSVLESSQVTSDRGHESIESSHTKLSSHARVRHYIQYSALLILVDGDAILLASYKINKPETGPDA